MTSRTLCIVLTLLLTAGCAQVKAIFTPPQPPSPPPPSARPERPEPPPRLTPQVSHDQEGRLMDEANKRIQGAEQNLQSIDARRLATDQQETYETVQSFLDQAKAALSRKDFARALNLAQKAHVLSDELSRTLR
ncbi:MAG: hypothetical protein ACREJ6_16070 [Candidatus Methylomirabilis sp.]